MAIDEMIEGLQIIDRDWRYVYVNAAVAKQGRKSKSELIGRTMMECYPGIENTPAFKDFQYVMKGGETRRLENEFVFEDGKKCWFELYIEGHTNGILIRSIDISEKKILEEQFRQAQKMEAIGQLAGGIAHDFNNQLAIMLAYCELALKNCGQTNPKTAGNIEKILKAVKKSASLTKQLLAFGRRQVLDIKVVNLNTVLSESHQSLVKLLGENINLICHFAPDLSNVNVDPFQLEQVFLNLCLNARDAMPSGGTLTVETANVTLDEEYCKRHMRVTPGNYAMLAITDTGQGMDRETMARIFEPFFTTKQRGHGTGLGLAMVHGFVNQSNGMIWAYSEPNAGSTFKVYLPVTSADASLSQPSKENGETLFEGNEHILLVEDDPMLREVYETTLRTAGYTVYSAGTGQEAEEVYFQHKSTIHIVLTDLMLPDLNGRELVEKLKKQTPALKVIYMSGYTENTIVHKGILDTESVLLQKPITLQNLLETLRRVLDGKLRKGLI